MSFAHPEIGALYCRVSPATRAHFVELVAQNLAAGMPRGPAELDAHQEMAGWCEESLKRQNSVIAVLNRRIGLLEASGVGGGLCYDPFKAYEAATGQQWPPTAKDIEACQPEIEQSAREVARRWFGVSNK